MPERASRDAAGTLPIRAVRYCEAVTLATSFGWLVYPPVDCLIRWDGRAIEWSADGDDWQPVEESAPFPETDHDPFASAPLCVRDMPRPALLTAIPEPGIVQVSLGVAARAAPGWGLLIRRPANFPVAGAIEHFEGIVDPAQWFGPLFINLRITKTDAPVRLYADRPLAQVQPVPLALLRGDALAFDVREMGPKEWADYAETVSPTVERPHRDFGEYAVRARKAARGGCPVAHA